MGKIVYAALAVIILSFVMGMYMYPQMPESMASHWNMENVVDGYMPKFWGLFLMPLASAGMLLLFIAIPRIDPLKHNIRKFRGHYDWFILAIILFLFYLHMLTMAWSMGFRFSMIQLLSPAFGLLFYLVGVLVGHARRNWFIGIRTPWTLSSERVWNKTHRLGGRLFKVSGAIALLGTVFPDYAIWLVVGPVILVAVYTMVYSYFEYQKGR
jgi:uncharacterized membrane protein